MFLIFFYFFKSYWEKKIWGDFQESPFLGGRLGGRPGVPLSRGDVQESPFWGVSSPTLGSRVPPKRGRGETPPLESPRHGDLGNASPASPTLGDASPWNTGFL